MTIRIGLNIIPFGAHADPCALVELAVAAEAAGWDGVFFWDHLNFEPFAPAVVDPWAVISAIAVRTSTIRLGTAVTPLPRHLPSSLARTITTADHLSNGRVVLGAGIGVKEEARHHGVPPSVSIRNAMADESLEVISRLFSGERVTFTGAHYEVVDTSLSPTPVQSPRPPIWIGAQRPSGLPRAIRWDGWVLASARRSPPRLAADVAAITSRRPPDTPFDVALIGRSSPRRATQLEDYEAAGATWWLELVGGGSSPAALDETRACIDQGPPTGGGRARLTTAAGGLVG